MMRVLMLVLLVAAMLMGPAPVLSGTADVVREKTLAAAQQYMKSGNILAGEGKYKEAIKSYRQAISLDPKSAEAYSLLGSALEQDGNLREAEDALRKAVSLKPDFAEGYYHLGVFLKAHGKEREAEEAFRKAKQYRR